MVALKAKFDNSEVGDVHGRDIIQYILAFGVNSLIFFASIVLMIYNC